MAAQIEQPLETYRDSDGTPLENGYIYVGTSGLNAETNQVSVYWDSDFTIPASQPIRTIGGFASRNGTKANIFVNGSYSIVIKDKNGVLVFSGDSLTDPAIAVGVNDAQLKVLEAEAEALTADSYANQLEDMFVDTYTSNGDGTFTATPTTDYSSFHWKQKAASFSTPALEEYVDNAINLAVNWQIANASNDGVSFDLSSEQTSPNGLFFKPDGTKMYVSDVTTNTIFQYTLSTPWDISTASYDIASFDTTAQDGDPTGIYIKDDGAKLYVSGIQNDAVFQYTLLTPWDISTATYDTKTVSVLAVSGQIGSVTFKTDGTKMYIVGDLPEAVSQYSLSAPWDVSTATYDSAQLNVSTEEVTPSGIVIKPNGEKIYITGTGGNSVDVYTMKTPWDLSTASYDGVTYAPAVDGFTSDIHISPDGEKMYLIGYATIKAYQFSIGSTT